MTIDTSKIDTTKTTVKTFFKKPKSGDAVKGELPKVINKIFDKPKPKAKPTTKAKPATKAKPKAKAAPKVKAKAEPKAKREPGKAVAAIIKVAHTAKGATTDELHKASGWGNTPWKQLFNHNPRGICFRFGFKPVEVIKKDGEPVRYRIVKK